MVAKVIRIPHEWSPRPYQRRLWDYLEGGGKRAVAVWHRRAGKDEVCLHFTAFAAFSRKGNYWHMLPEYSQARKAIWEAINPHTGRRRIDEVFPHEVRETTREQEMMIRLVNGSTWQLIGSDNYNSLMGSPPVGVVFSEYATANPAAWGYIRPILLENGGWAVFISTPRGNNHFRSLYRSAQNEPDWFTELLSARDTGIFTEEALEQERRQMIAEHGEEFGVSLWQQEYFCSFDAALPGSIWGDCIERARREGRIARVEIDPALPVFTGWDLGRTDDTAIWFYQVVGNEIRVVDFHSSSGKEIAFYGELLRDWARTHGVSFGIHWLPHDARPRRLGMGGKSILQQLQEEGIGRCAIAPRLDIEEGIQAARRTFPRCWFDETRCEKGLDALAHYHREWDEEKRAFTQRPHHDWSSHAADAWRTVALTWRTEPARRDEARYDERIAREFPNVIRFGDIKKRHFERMREREALRI